MSNLQVLKQKLDSQGVREKFNEMLGSKAPGFISSIISAVSQNNKLMDADPGTVLTAASIAATLDLPINQSLGLAYIVPYKNKAQFQIGYKGLIQLAIRTNQYKTINSCEIYDGELISFDRISGKPEVDYSKKKSNNVIGFMSYFCLTSGFEKWYYMTVEDVNAHAKKYSQSYSYTSSIWQTDFEAMALKTVLKLLLSKWGILSIELQKAVTVDQSVVDEDGNPIYIDKKKSFNDEEIIEARISDEELEKELTKVEKEVKDGSKN